MIGALLFLVISLLESARGQSVPASPCPRVFEYESTEMEPGRWYGSVSIFTDTTLNSLWLNIVLDRKADILGNWDGNVTTKDNTDYQIENTAMKIRPGPPVKVRFFVNYNVFLTVPRLVSIRLNDREICKTARRLAVPVVTDPPPTRPDDSWFDDDRANGSVDTSLSRSLPGDQMEHKVRSSDERITNYDMAYLDFNVPEDSEEYYYDEIENENCTNSGEQITSSNMEHKELKAPKVTIEETNDTTITTSKEQCGKVIRNNVNLLVAGGRTTLEGQWPWHIALYRIMTVDSTYQCGGTLVSHRHVVTAAHCVTDRNGYLYEKNAFTIILGKHNLRTSVEGVETRFVAHIIVHRDYNKATYARDLSILKMSKPVEYTEFVRPICLWPEELSDLSNVIGRTGSVVGWGMTEDATTNEELALVLMPVVDQETCLRSNNVFFGKVTDKDYTYCAGSRDGRTVCTGDSGGGMVFEMQGTWYLRGLVSLSEKLETGQCNRFSYVVFTDLAKFVPWIKDRIG